MPLSKGDAYLFSKSCGVIFISGGDDIFIERLHDAEHHWNPMGG